jgi:hypothetical protein
MRPKKRTEAIPQLTAIIEVANPLDRDNGFAKIDGGVAAAGTGKAIRAKRRAPSALGTSVSQSKPLEIQLTVIF